METAATLRYARISAQKGSLVADQVRGLPVDRALNLLAFSNKMAAELFMKVLESAIANAEHNDGADVDELKVTKVFVDEGPSQKRYCFCVLFCVFCFFLCFCFFFVVFF